MTPSLSRDRPSATPFPEIIVLALLPALALATSDVLDVDAQNGPYFDIFPAVAAAQPGDVVRVAPGSYGFFGVFGKSLTVVASGGPGSVAVQGAIRIQALAADDRVLLSGISAEGASGSGDGGLIVADCTGSVRVQDGTFGSGETAAVSILRCDDVALDGVFATGGSLPIFGGRWGQPGLYVEDTALTLTGCDVRGGPTSAQTYTGASGVLARRSDLYVASSRAEGGQGGPDNWNFGTQICQPSGDGGPGVQVDTCNLRSLDNVFAGGLPGPPSDLCAVGVKGPDVLAGGSTVTDLPGLAPRFDLDDLVVGGAPVALTATGETQDVILIALGPAPGRTTVPAQIGDLLVGGSAGTIRRAFLGTGSVSTTLTAPPLPPLGIESLFLQTVHVRAGGLVFGPARTLTVLGSGW